jgi:uncharacterized protein (TIGR03067 family)
MTRRVLAAGWMASALMLGVGFQAQAGPGSLVTQLHGEWKIEAVEAKGKVIDGHRLAGGVLSFDADRVVFRTPAGEVTERLQFEITTCSGDGTGGIKLTGDGSPRRYPLQGLLQLKGEVLKICVALPPEPSATELKTRLGDKRELWTVRRIK